MKDDSIPNFSIVTCSFRDLENLKETAKSVLEQDFPVEWIIVDADSGEDHRTFLNSLKSDVHSIKWVSEKDRGIYDGMNKGFNLSSGDVILFLNSGDCLVENTVVRKVLKVFSDSMCLWVVALAVRVDKDGEPRSVWEYLKPELGGLALGTRTFCHQSTFYKRSLLEDVLPYDISNLAADHLLNIKAFRRATPKMMPQVTTYFKDGGVSSKRPFSAAMKDLQRIRIEENLLLGKSKLLDTVISSLVVFTINFGAYSWAFMRRVSRKLVSDDSRISPE